jgi:hypothetical protein
MNLRKLPELLARITEIFERSGAKRHAQGLKALEQVLAEEIAQHGNEAFEAIRRRLETTHSRSKSSRPSSRSKRSVEEYVARLTSLPGETGLEELIHEFEAASFKKVDLDRIAHCYAKGPSKYRSKADAIRDIRQRFIQSARARGELEYLDKKKVTPW